MERNFDLERVLNIAIENSSLEEGFVALNHAIEEARRQGNEEAAEILEGFRIHLPRLHHMRRSREEFARTQPQPRQCLRCDDVTLRVEPSADPEVNEKITFYLCQSCGRRFALSPGCELCDAWGSLISHVLYDVLYRPDTMGEQSQLRSIAHNLTVGQSHDEIAKMIAEVELELEHPTQQVRDILDANRKEEDLRRILWIVVNEWKKVLWTLSLRRASLPHDDTGLSKVDN